MPDKITELLEEEINERIEASKDFDRAAGCYGNGAGMDGDYYAAMANAAVQRAECYRLNRLKLERSNRELH
jgi:hypothetical protein